MTTYYVRKTGSDANNGTNPSDDAKLTVAAGLALLSSGDILDVGAGTYAENDGSGYLFINDTFASETEIRRDPSSAYGDVVITGAGGAAAYAVVLFGVTNLLFSGIVFDTHRTGQTAVLLTRNATSGCRLVDCGVRDAGGALASSKGLIQCGAGSAGNVTLENITLTSSTANVFGVLTQDSSSLSIQGGTITTVSTGVRQTAAYTGSAISVDGVTFDCPSAAAIDVVGGTLGNPMSLTVTNNNFDGCQDGLIADQYIANATVTGNSGTVTGSYGLSIGQDSAGGGAFTSPTIDNNNMAGSGALTHVYLIGQNCTGAVYGEDNRFDASATSGGYGIVVKGGGAGGSAHSITIKGVNYGGGNSGVYFKGCSGATMSGNGTIRMDLAGGVAVKILNGDTTPVSDSITLSGITLISTDGSLYNIGSEPTHIGNLISIDRMIYSVSGSGSWGSVRADTSVASLEELRTAWDGYALDNDEYSREFSDSVSILRGKLSGIIGRPLRGRI